MADERPKCRHCGKPLRQVIHMNPEAWDWQKMIGMSEKEARRFRREHSTPTDRYGYLGTGFFCTQSCGHWYAVRLLQHRKS